MASVINALKKHTSECNLIVVATAQHRHLLDQALTYFEIKPDIDLDVMREQQTPSDVLGRMLLHLEPLLKKTRPDVVMVQGDTATCFAASLASFYQGIKVTHVEAGLRTWDKENPFPEELHRRSVDFMSDVCFAPTESARANLIKDNVAQDKIFVVGNTAIDVLSQIINQPRQIDLEIVKNVCGDRKRIIIVTAHRRENTMGPITKIFEALRELAEKNSDIQLVFPVHPNPQVRKLAFEALGNLGNVQILEPLTYNVFIGLLSRSYLVLTDSGGVQEEAAYLGKPVLVLREKTERTESIDSGVAKLVGTDPVRILSEANSLLTDEKAYDKMARPTNPYGEGSASTQIVDILLDIFCKP